MSVYRVPFAMVQVEHESSLTAPHKVTAARAEERVKRVEGEGGARTPAARRARRLGERRAGCWRGFGRKCARANRAEHRAAAWLTIIDAPRSPRCRILRLLPGGANSRHTTECRWPSARRRANRHAVSARHEGEVTAPRCNNHARSCCGLLGARPHRLCECIAKCMPACGAGRAAAAAAASAIPFVRGQGRSSGSVRTSCRHEAALFWQVCGPFAVYRPDFMPSPWIKSAVALKPRGNLVYDIHDDATKLNNGGQPTKTPTPNRTRPYNPLCTSAGKEDPWDENRVCEHCREIKESSLQEWGGWEEKVTGSACWLPFAERLKVIQQSSELT